MGRIYTCSYQGTLTAAGGDADLIEILPADDKPTKLLGWIISQWTEVGDTAEEALRLSVLRLPATVTSGSGGSAVTPQSLDATNNVAYGGTVEMNNSTVATTSGTAITLMEMAWNERVMFEFWFPEPKLIPVVRQGEGLFVRCQTTAGDDISVALTFFIEEE